MFQAAVFTGATVAGSAFAGATKVLLSHLLDVRAFGNFSFALALLQIGGMLVEFGLFLPVALLATHNPDRSRELMGSALALYVPLAIGFDLAVFGTSFAVDDVFSAHAGAALRASAPLAFIYPFVLVAMLLSQGIDRLHLSSIAAPLGSGLLALVFAVSLLVGAHVSAVSALVASSATLVVAHIPLVVRLRPLFSNMRSNIVTFVDQARAYGFGVYVGRVLGIGTYQMDVLMLGALANPRVVGWYVLAGAIANTIAIPSSGVGNALFGKFARSNDIGRPWLVLSVCLGASGVVLAWALSDPFLTLLFPPSYGAASSFVVALSIAAALRGTTSLYNNYLAAHGMGRDLRRAAYTLTGSNLLLNLTLIPAFGGLGAAWASAAALCVNLITHMFYYARRPAAV